MSRVCPDSITLVIVSIWLRSWERVDRPLRKPCWLVGRRLLSERCCIMADEIICSNILIMCEVRDIGR